MAPYASRQPIHRVLCPARVRGGGSFLWSRPLDRDQATYLRQRTEPIPRPIIWARLCSVLLPVGFTPPRLTTKRRELLPHVFTLTPAVSRRGGLFSVALSTLPDAGSSARYAAPRSIGARTFLSAHVRRSDPTVVEI